VRRRDLWLNGVLADERLDIDAKCVAFALYEQMDPNTLRTGRVDEGLLAERAGLWHAWHQLESAKQ